MDKGDNPYQLLDVPQNADYVIIKKAYRRLALAHHPDRGGDPIKFAKIANAYEILSDPKHRHNFDLQQRNGFKGYDPSAPTFTSTRDDYDPSKPDYQPPSSNTNNTNTTTKTNVPCYYDPDDQGDDVQETWTTYTTMKNGVPVTQTRKNKTYTRTTTTTDTKPMMSKTTTQSFHMDPMELFRQHFPEGAKAHSKSPRKTMKQQQTTPTMTTKTKTKVTKIPSTTMMMSPNLNSSSTTADDDIVGMASGTRTVTHPNGQQELITETVITRADGSTETKVESKMISGPTTKITSSPMKTTKTTTQKSPMNQPTTYTTFQSPTGTKMKTTTSYKSPTKKSVTVNNSTGSGMMPTPRRTTTTTTMTTTLTSPNNNNYSKGKNRHIVIKNGKPVVIYDDE